jgi:hypothetical protein
MLLLPFDYMIINTPLNPGAAYRILIDNVEERTTPFFDFQPRLDTKPYLGVIGSEKFRIWKVISYRNSFLPIIRGTIKENNSGTILKITMMPAMSVLLFMSVWFGGLIFALVFLLLDKNDGKLNPAFIIPLLIIGMGLLFVSAGFNAEAISSKEDMKRIFGAKD